MEEILEVLIMPIVKMTEMYDLKTTKDKIGVLGIHTPDANIVSKRWLGLYMNYKYMRVLGCSFRVACASLLPADPLQVSTEAGSVAPQDVMNPILYRAVSNDSWNYIVGRLYASSNESTSVNFVEANSSGSAAGAENVYYALLGDTGWKKALPQSGFSMSRLRPLVYNVVNTFGTMDTAYDTGTANLNDNPYSSNANGVAFSSGTATTFRGHAVPYPRIPATRPSTGSDTANPSFAPSPIAKTYVACIVLPPGKLTEFYFRLVVDWYVEFTGITSLVDKMSYAQSAGVGSLVYARNYTFPSATSAKELVSDQETVTEESSVDSIDADVNLIMEN